MVGFPGFQQSGPEAPVETNARTYVLILPQLRSIVNGFSCISVQYRRKQDTIVGATLCGRPAGLPPISGLSNRACGRPARLLYTTNIGVVQPGDHTGSPLPLFLLHPFSERLPKSRAVDKARCFPVHFPYKAVTEKSSRSPWSGREPP